MSRFKGASQAKVSEQGQKLSDGKHLLEIKRITYSDGGKNGDYYVVEFTVLESDSALDATNRQIDKKGDERVWTQNMSKKVIAFPKLNAFVYAAMGYDRKNNVDAATLAKEVTPEIESILEATLDESDPLGFAGRKVWAVTKKIESNGDPFAQYDL